MVARLYSVIIRVKVAGARSGAFDLEVPLQVINSPLSTNQTEEVPTPEPQQSEPSRRESEVELASDELAVRQKYQYIHGVQQYCGSTDYLKEQQKDPPHYYP